MAEHTGGSASPDRIVVGVDGSPQSKLALAWAARQAKLTNVPLEVVIAWELPTTYGWAAPLPEGLDFEKDSEGVVNDEVTSVIGPEAAASFISPSASSRAILPPCSCTSRRPPPSSSWLAGGMVPSPACCSDGSASTSLLTPTVR